MGGIACPVQHPLLLTLVLPPAGEGLCWLSKRGQVSEERKPAPPQHLTPSRGPRQPPRQADRMPTPAETGRTRNGQEPGRVRGERDRHHWLLCAHFRVFKRNNILLLHSPKCLLGRSTVSAPAAPPLLQPVQLRMLKGRKNQKAPSVKCESYSEQCKRTARAS